MRAIVVHEPIVARGPCPVKAPATLPVAASPLELLRRYALRSARLLDGESRYSYDRAEDTP